MTETSATFTSHSAEDYREPPGQLRPRRRRSATCRSSASDGEDLPVGAVGELWAKGPKVVSGYWNKPEATAETFVDGWVQTGDLARIDEEGFLYIIDRAKDMLIRGGENIYCVEVENVALRPSRRDGRRPRRHPAQDAGRGAGRGREPEARNARRPRRSCARSWPAGSPPSRCRSRSCFWPETLPRNANGKIMKAELRQLFDAQVADSVGRARAG